MITRTGNILFATTDGFRYADTSELMSIMDIYDTSLRGFLLSCPVDRAMLYIANSVSACVLHYLLVRVSKLIRCPPRELPLSSLTLPFASLD